MWVMVLSYLIQLPSLWATLRQKAKLCHGFVMLPQGQNKKGESAWRWCLYLLHNHSQLIKSLYWPQQQAFAFIHSVMNEDQYTEPDREEVTRAVLQHFQVILYFMSNRFREQYFYIYMYSGTCWDRCACYCSPGLVGLSSWLGRSCLQIAGKSGRAIQLSSGNLWSKVCPQLSPLYYPMEVLTIVCMMF